MNPEQLVPTRELCKQLVDAGIVLDTYFVWYRLSLLDNWILMAEMEIDYKVKNKNQLLKDKRLLPAPTAEELFDYLKNEIYAVFSIAENQSGISITMNDSLSGFERVDSQTLASALAELAIKVKEV